MPRHPSAILCGAALLLGYGCAAPADAPPPTTAGSQPAVARAATPPPSQAVGGLVLADVAGTDIDARPAALIAGRTVSWGDLRPLLNEAAGATALQELILDTVLSEEIAAAGIVIGENRVAAERLLLLESLHEDPEVSLRLLHELRTRQGLGRVRFESLLRRNAALRALVQPRVNISEAEIRNLYDAVHGPKRQARIITVPGVAELRAVLDALEGGESFTDLAMEHSTDISAARGGLLEPIGRHDPAYPEALLTALWHLEPGSYSTPIMLDGQYALLMLVREVDGDGSTFDDARPGLERRARLRQERMLMDQLARAILSDVRITIFDEALRESWRQRGRQVE
jgi:foldase protein PrsA